MSLENYPLWTALITPMNSDSSVDYPTLKKLLKEQEEAKNGILILGSTGEALNIDDNERKEILEFTIKQKLKVPLMCGVGGVNLRETKEWIKYLETLSIDAYLMVTPLYAKPGAQGQYLWFKELLDLSSRPVMLYNVPSRTGCSLNFEAVKKLSGHPKFWAIKEASGSNDDFKRYHQAAPNAQLYSGDDGKLPDFAPLGAKGLVSVASNVWPKQTHLYTKKCLEKKLKDVNLWKQSCDALFLASNPIPAKVLLHKLGRISSPTLRPPLCHEESFDHQKLFTANEQIENWSE